MSGHFSWSSRLSFRRFRPWTLLLAVGVACVPTARPPEVAPTGKLQLPPEASSSKMDGPFAIVFAGPQGETDGTGQISVVFNRAVRALSPAGEEAPVPFVIEPAIDGSWHPVGTNAFLFAPATGRLPQATQYRVTVPQSLNALDGSKLAADYRFDFSTPRPAIARSSPWDGETSLGPKTSFEIDFNQPIEPSRVQAAVRLNQKRGGKSTSLAYRLDVPDPKSHKRFVLRPERSLPADSTIELVVSAELRGKEGPLPTGSERVLSFQTYGKLRVENVECSRDQPGKPCSPTGGFWLHLSNAVKFSDLKKSLSIDPPVALRWESWRDEGETVSYLDLNGRFLPGKTYKIRVDGALTDVYGQKLGASSEHSLAIGDYFPEVQIGVNGDYFEPSQSRPIPVASLNVARFDLTAAALRLDDVLSFVNASDDVEGFEKFREKRKPKARVVVTNAAKNTPAQENLDPKQVLAASGGRGPLLIAAEYEDAGERQRRVRLVQVTDLAISAKLSATDASVVWVTNLSNGAPVSDAEVSIARPDGANQIFKTDAQGIARLPAAALGANIENNASQTLVVVKKGADWSYRRVSDYLSPWRANVPVDVFGQPESYGLLFTERGIYRPGDEIQLKGILRREANTGNDVLAHQKFTIALRSPDWQIIESHAVQTSAYGSFSKTIRLPATASLGQYRLEVKELEGNTSTYFEVAEYKPVEMQARVSSDKPSYVQGGAARFEVGGDYLFGAPMNGAAVTYRATRSETYWSVPNLDGFVTDAALYDHAHPEKAPSAGLLLSGEGALDARGRFTQSVSLALPGQRSPELVGFDAEVTDVSRQTVASSSTAIVHPADFYVGVKQPDPYFVTTPGVLRPDVVVTTPEGKRVVGQSVELSLLRRRWTLVRETSGDRADSEMRVVDEKVSSCATKSTATTATCDLSVTGAGYYVVLATAKDTKGRVARAAVDSYALGAGESYWQDDDTLRVELVADKKQYKKGDVARVLVKSPFTQADALVTVEGNGVRSERRVVLEGATPTLSIPITDDMRPNAYVAVHLVRPRSSSPKQAGRADIGAPTYRTGHVELRVDPEARRLAVQLKANKTDFAPGESIDVDLSVKDSTGKGATSEVTVYAVDEGVLSLIGYRTPDPLPIFTASRPLRVATLESRDSLAHVTPDLAEALGLGPSKGADGGGGGDEAGGARRDFRQSAYFNPAVLTSANGTAHVKFKLPESLTTYRLMAVATTQDDRYGYFETRVTTSKKLMARPALPRVLRAGDEAEIGVAVTGKGFGPASVDVTLRATGLELTGPTQKTIELPENGSIEVRFPVRATTVGTAKLHFDVKGGALHDAVEVERKVLLPSMLETVALYGQTKKASAEEIGDLSSVRRDVGELEVQTASTALVGIDGGFEQLLDYPYGCSEQLTSRLLPLLSLRDIARDFGVALPARPEVAIEKTLAELLSRQRGDGGFGMWPESAESSKWVTPYVLFALHDAKGRGFSVSDSALTRGVEYLRRELAAMPDSLSLASAAFHLDVLALLGKPDAGYMNSLFAQRAELPVFARALLLHAMAISKQPAADVDALRRELENGLRVEANRAYFAENLGDAYAVLLDSPARTTALVLRALLAVDPEHALGAKLARGLLDERDRGAWRSTQETAFSLLALDAYRKAQEKEVPDFLARVWSGEAQLFEASSKGRSAASQSHSIPVAQLNGGRLTFEKTGTGTLFYEARLRYAKKALPIEPLDRGFYVQKTYRAVDPTSLDAALSSVPNQSTAQLPAGSLVLVDLVVVASGPRHFTVIDDPLPAGLEAIDSRLQTSAAWTSIGGSSADGQSPSDDEIAAGSAFSQSWYRKEVRDDRVVFFVDHMTAGLYHYRYLARATTFGRFVVPPTRAEEMYTPEVFGRTRGEVIEVR